MTDETEAVARALCVVRFGDEYDAELVTEYDRDLAKAAITALDKHRIERAGEVEAELHTLAKKYHLSGGCLQTELDRQAAATIASLRQPSRQDRAADRTRGTDQAGRLSRGDRG